MYTINTTLLDLSHMVLLDISPSELMSTAFPLTRQRTNPASPHSLVQLLLSNVLPQGAPFGTHKETGRCSVVVLHSLIEFKVGQARDNALARSSPPLGCSANPPKARLNSSVSAQTAQMYHLV